MVEKEGLNASQAENGSVALERIEEALPDLILLDLMMPVMDGFEFILKLRNKEECRDVPVIVVTAKDLTDEDRFRLTGAVDQIIQKGAFSREKFLRDVSALIEQHRTKNGEENDKDRIGGSTKEGETT